jgi:threonine aldolase
MSNTGYIDLRSDTVTRPSAAMREAIASAVVGDDVFGDDPTVIELESRVAELFGKEAALFVPSGSMGNQISLYTNSTPGDEIICERGCHIFNYEVATVAALSGLLTQVVDGIRGVFTPADIEGLIRPGNLHSPRTVMIAIENTHNRAGGSIFPIDVMQALRELCDSHQILLHLDGARIWNAHVATQIPLTDYAACADTMSICFSKGLGAPVGSAVLGERDFINRARRTRKMFGGGMRQAGILAAAALYAIDHNLARLSEDHDNAWYFAESVSEIEGIYIDLDSVHTNIIVMDIAGSTRSIEDVVASCREKGLLIVPFGATYIRAVTHLDVDRDDVRDAIQIMREVFESA